ncbi:MAG: hypothetical protein ACYCZ0_03290 [Minisyncoccota bacterium]
MRKLLMVAVGILAACISGAAAQEAAKPAAAEEKKPLLEIVVNDGVAFSWRKHEKGARIDYDIVSAWQNAKKGGGPDVADCDKYQTKLKGAMWCFASAANLKKFLAETDKDGENAYLPFAGGRCALGASWGRLQAPGDPRTARVIDGDLGPMLILHSAEKWWPMFKKDMFTRLQIAQMRLDFAVRLGDIVPNEKLTESSAQRR